MPRQSFDNREDEQLSIEVRKYPAFFVKSNAWYQENGLVENAWKKIDDIIISNFISWSW